jgi:hypothetical protein
VAEERSRVQLRADTDIDHRSLRKLRLENASALMRWGWNPTRDEGGPSFLTTRGGGISATVYRMNFELVAPLDRGSPSAARPIRRPARRGYRGEIRHDIVMVRLIAEATPRATDPR